MERLGGSLLPPGGTRICSPVGLALGPPVSGLAVGFVCGPCVNGQAVRGPFVKGPRVLGLAVSGERVFGHSVCEKVGLALGPPVKGAPDGTLVGVFVVTVGQNVKIGLFVGQGVGCDVGATDVG